MGMDWKRFQRPPITEWAGRDIFIGIALGGITVMVIALGGVYLDGFRARLGGFLAGAGLTLGAASTLALAYGDWPEEDCFALKIAARAGFLPIAPCAVLAELPYLLEELGPWGCAGLSAITVVPFGLSLTRLIWKKRNLD